MRRAKVSIASKPMPPPNSTLMQTAHAGGVHGLQFGVCHRGRHHADTAQPVRMTAQHFQHVAVVGAVTLICTSSAHALRVQHGQIGLLGRAMPLRGQHRVGRHDVRVRIAGARRNLEAGCFDPFLGRQAKGTS